MGLGNRAAAFGVRRPGANPGAHHPRGEVGREFGLEVRTCPSAEAEGPPGAHMGIRLPPPCTLRTVALHAPDLAWRDHKEPPPTPALPPTEPEGPQPSSHKPTQELCHLLDSQNHPPGEVLPVQSQEVKS